MSNPQQPELARSRKTPSQDQDAVAGVVEGQRDLGLDAPRGPVPPENQPGHHPPEEQDKPDLEAFAERLGTKEPGQRDGTEEGEHRPAPVAAAKEAVSVGADSAVSAGRGGAVRAALGAVAVALVTVLFLGRKRRRQQRR